MSKEKEQQFSRKPSSSSAFQYYLFASLPSSSSSGNEHRVIKDERMSIASITSGPWSPQPASQSHIVWPTTSPVRYPRQRQPEPKEALLPAPSVFPKSHPWLLPGQL